MKERSAAEAAQLIRRWCPDVRLDTIEELPHFGWGGDSDAFLVDGTHVFRFARFAGMRHGYAVERCVLPLLTRRLAAAGVHVAVPAFSHVGPVDSADGGPLFVGYPLVPGRQLTAAGLQRLVQEEGTAAGSTFDQIARALGQFLSVLHTTPLEETRTCGVPEPRIPLREQIERQLGSLRRSVYPLLDPDSRAFLDGVLETFLGDPRYTDRPLALCHGDLSSDHILVDSQDGRTRLSGVIDFGDLCVGDASGDFAGWRGEYGEEFFWRVLEHYPGTADEKRVVADVATFRQALIPTVEIGYGIDTDNRDYVEVGKAALAEVMRRQRRERRS